MRFFALFFGIWIAGCDHGIYTRDGVTDGDTFYLAPSAMSDDDPAVQSWVTYSLFKSACQLQIGGEIPARASSFDCELKSRQQLVNAWEEKSLNNPEVSDEYLDTLGDVRVAGFLAEYTLHYFGQSDWQLPAGMRTAQFRQWRMENLRRHRPLTRIIGSWNYRDTVEKNP